MANVLFIKGDTTKINSTTITDGQLLWNTVTGEIWEDVGTSRIACGKLVDTSLNPTSPNAVSNQAITGSIVNSLATVLSTTENYVPCGTKPVKELYDEINGTVLWTNLNPLTAFAGQVVSLNGSLSDYESYEIVYALQETGNSPVFRTGKIPVARNTELLYSAGANIYRFVNVSGNTSVSFSNCQTFPLDGGASSTTNTKLIPLNVIGYK